jgi:hypothetical protein
MSVSPSDVAALRRIALLVTRAVEDCTPMRPELLTIVTVIDRMKRGVALGAPFQEQDVARLSSLIRHLPADQASPVRLREALVGELRELMH